MKEIKLDTKTINIAAQKAGTTPEKFVSMVRSISSGHKVCAHFSRTEGDLSVFICA